MSNSKYVLIGTFVQKDKILTFLEYLKRKFHLDLNYIFVYEIDGNDNEYIVTFKTSHKEKYLQYIKNSTVMHVKNNCLFSINALNKMIERETQGNVPNNEYLIDWDNFKNKIIILTNGELNIQSIRKIEDKSKLFS